MAVDVGARTSPAPAGAWLARETRIGRHLYPLRAIAVAVGAGAATAVIAVLAAVALLVD
jgi:hypothetical protein